MFYKCDAHLQDGVPTWRLSRGRRAASHKETRASRIAGALSRNEAPTLVATSSSCSRSAENKKKPNFHKEQEMLQDEVRDASLRES